MAKLLYFGQVAEIANRHSEELPIEEMSIADFRIWLERKIPELTFVSYQISANQQLHCEAFMLTNDMEIAILPPFAGG
ncbi:MAG: hypothetical protein RLZZ337_1314 [Bacteroidota bacterium]|jgi:molybdopterin synthase sulfur carrier subunit